MLLFTMQYQRGNTKSEILSFSTCGKIDFDFTTKKKKTILNLITGT